MGPALIKKRKVECQEVPVYTLDTFMSDVLNDTKSIIDHLSIDVEGFDALVLEGASQTLPRVRYLEFEYNWKGPWLHKSLSALIMYLKQHGFACYWAGTHGHIWRITNCWHS